MRVAFWIIISGGLVILIDLIAYSAGNLSGHSGLDPMAFLPIFAFILLIGLVGHFWTKGKIRYALTVEAIGMTGMAFCLFVTQLNILNSHENWTAAGMPERHALADVLILGFVITATIASFLYAFFTGAKIKGNRDHN